uniref:Uncharacterized protein n=1 Tax=Chelydra serpentina TaxID=8475 RepID=A0A8C3SP85_CHESE
MIWLLAGHTVGCLVSLVTQHKDFDAGFVPLQKKLSAIRAKVDLENEPQPDLSGKETQLQRLQVCYNDGYLWYLHVNHAHVGRWPD